VPRDAARTARRSMRGLA